MHDGLCPVWKYGNDRKEQSKILSQLLQLEWQLVAPGHGHVRDYTTTQKATAKDRELMLEEREPDMQGALKELSRW